MDQLLTYIAERLDQGIALHHAGRLSEALELYRQVLQEVPGNIPILNNLANSLHAAGRFAEANDIYLKLLHEAKPPLAWRIASSYVSGLQYSHEISDARLHDIACIIGAQLGRENVSFIVPEAGKKIRVGFVSADLCDHPVGFFLTPLLTCLDRSRFEPILYAVRIRADKTARSLQALADWRDCSLSSPAAMLDLLRADGLDVLIDLSGHTEGNRLPLFAQRAAPLQVSWLGYFSTTGVPAMDAVFMDSWHVPDGAESQFSERLIRLPNSRFCYVPVDFAPEVSDPPCKKNGFMTFGSFNNTCKLNAQVLSVWATILHAIPGSRLILKWPTFSDSEYRASIRDFFSRHEIDSDRIELRTQSSHADLLNEYADIDIALDPFPFTGGHTSCEVLWMGLPIVTLEGSRPVARQTLCFLANIGLTEWVAKTQSDYVKIAVTLANDPNRLKMLRHSMRSKMRASPLMDARQFAKNFEEALLSLIEEKRMYRNRR